MRRRVRKLLPIVLIAVMVQILALVAACWAASIAASDPLHAAAICHDDGASSSGQTDQTGQPRAHDGCCSACSVPSTGVPVDAPPTAVATPHRHPPHVLSLHLPPPLLVSAPCSH